MDVYIGAGHGRRPDGVFDPGNSFSGLIEHDLAHRVVDAYAAALRRSGVRVRSERDSGAGHDPNWVGSARRANELGVKVADEVHFNAAPVPDTGSGVEVFVHPATSEANRQACRAMAAGIARVLDLPLRRDRGVGVSGEFGFLRATRMPAAIIEVAFLNHARDRAAISRRGALRGVGEEIAKARCAFLGVPFRPPERPSRTPIAAPPSAPKERAHAWADARGAARVFHRIIDEGWPQAADLGIDPAVFVAQAAKETAFGRFGGVLDASFRNSGGLKTRQGGSDTDPRAHQRFPTWRAGTRAHCAHLALYAGVIDADEAARLGDPRAFPSVRGTARAVEQLGEKWAPGADYGRSIVRDFLKPLRAHR